VDRQEALAIVTPVLDHYFQDNSLEQTLLLWASMAEDVPQRVGPILAAFEFIANDASLDLRPILLEHGWINLFHMIDGEPVVYTSEEHREWLLQVISRLREAAGVKGSSSVPEGLAGA
jgi:hypothetical protein